MEQFPGNSQHVTGEAKTTKTPKDPKVITQVVTTEVIKRPTSLSKRFKNVFLGSEGRGAGTFIVMDILLPALRNLIVDVANTTSKGVERKVFGTSSAAPRRGYAEPGRPRITYNSPLYRDPRGPSAMLPDQSPRQGPRIRREDAGEIIVPDRNEAQDVLVRLNDVIEKYEVASVADLYELCGLPTSTIDNKWGWYSLPNAGVRQVREGYMIDLPRPEPIT